MKKVPSTIISVAAAVVILVIAYRIFDGAGGTAKFFDFEFSVDNKQIENANASSANNTQLDKNKITKQFTRKFEFKNHTCDINTQQSIQGCVDAGYVLDGMVGEINYIKKDRCGSNFVSFEKTNDTCGKVNVQLQGCGYDSERTCISHAFLKGDITLQGYKFE